MNRVASRAAIAVLLVLLLVAGMGFFVAEYVMNAKDWVMFAGSPHVYSGGNIGCGTVIDRDGYLLLDMENGKIDFSGLRDSDNAVTEGTSLVTSNISDKYLPGLLIGYVSEISLDSNNLTKSGTLIPAADFRGLREVLIITDLKQTKENS